MQIVSDYYVWIENFIAVHPIYGTIIADLRNEIIADSKEAYDNFIINHPMKEFDLWDI
jgi:hypothetical protein